MPRKKKFDPERALEVLNEALVVIEETGERRWEADPVQGPVRLMGNPMRMSASDVPLAASPLLGEHTDELLRDDLGLDAPQLHARDAVDEAQLSLDRLDVAFEVGVAVAVAGHGEHE